MSLSDQTDKKKYFFKSRIIHYLLLIDICDRKSFIAARVGMFMTGERATKMELIRLSIDFCAKWLNLE